MLKSLSLSVSYLSEILLPLEPGLLESCGQLFHLLDLLRGLHLLGFFLQGGDCLLPVIDLCLFYYNITINHPLFKN